MQPRVCGAIFIVRKRRCFTFIAFKIWSRILSGDGLCKPGGLKFEWKFRFLVYVYDVNLFFG